MEDSLAQDEVKQTRIVRLDDEEEDLLDWDGEECRTKDHILWISPYFAPNDYTLISIQLLIRIPGFRIL